MNNYIVTEPSRSIRAMAREHLRGRWAVICAGTLLFLFLSIIIPEFFEDIVPFGRSQQTLLTGDTTEFSVIASFYQFFFDGVFAVGYSVFMLAFVRLKDINLGYIFDGFEYFLRCLGLTIVMGVFIVLWSLLFVIPGIIAAIRYSQAYYILADDPSKGIFQCIEESKMMMMGNKMKYFTLSLSFLGWIILASIPGGILFSVFRPVPGTPMNFLVFVLTMIPIVFMITYMQTALTVFYEMVSGHLRPRMTEFPPQQEGPSEWDNYNMR